MRKVSVAFEDCKYKFEIVSTGADLPRPARQPASPLFFHFWITVDNISNEVGSVKNVSS